MPKADVGILTVIPAELKAVRAALGINAKEKDAEGTTFWRCTLASQALGRPLEIVAGCIGSAGNYSAATATTRMIAQYKPRIVFLVGIAAGIRGKVKIGEVVLAERIVAYEHAAAVVDQHGNSALQRRPEIHPTPHRIKQDLVGYLADSPAPDRLQQIFAAIGGTFPIPPPGEAEAYARDVVGRIEAPSEATVASGEKLLRDPSFLPRVRENVHGKIEVGEMEAAGFVEACRTGEVQWLVVRGISDFGDSFKNDAFHDLAARAAAAVLVDFLTHGLELDLPRAPAAATTAGTDNPIKSITSGYSHRAQKSSDPIPEPTRQFRERHRAREMLASRIRAHSNLPSTLEISLKDRHIHLEAEVEIEAEIQNSGAWFRREAKTRRLRLEPSLTDALEQCTDKIVLLEGEPGSGKTVSLHRVERHFAQEIRKNPDCNLLLPLCVKLKYLTGHGSPREQLMNCILRALDPDVLLAEQLFVQGVKSGGWLLLLDGFDEIPSILSAVEVNGPVREYALAIHDLHAEINQDPDTICRVVVATRHYHGPKGLWRSIFRLRPLSPNRQIEFIHKYGLSKPKAEQLIDHVSGAQIEVQRWAGNPLTLAMLCEVVQAGHQPPDNFFHLFEHYLELRFDRDAELFQGFYGGSVDELRRAAEQISFVMSAEPGLGIAPSSRELRRALEHHGFPAHDLEDTLTAFEKLNLVIREEHEDELFTGFRHRRLQEYFAACVIRREPERIPPEVLLFESQWREAAVVLLQQSPGDCIERLIVTIDEALVNYSSVLDVSEDVDVCMELDPKIPPCKIVWPEKSYHLLSLLQAGFAGRRRLPENTEMLVLTMLCHIYRLGIRMDKHLVLGLIGVLSPDLVKFFVLAGFDSKSELLQDSAFSQVQFAGPPCLVVRHRVSRLLIRMARSGTLAENHLATRARIRRTYDETIELLFEMASASDRYDRLIRISVCSLCLTLPLIMAYENGVSFSETFIIAVLVSLPPFFVLTLRVKYRFRLLLEGFSLMSLMVFGGLLPYGLEPIGLIGFPLLGAYGFSWGPFMLIAVNYQMPMARREWPLAVPRFFYRTLWNRSGLYRFFLPITAMIMLLWLGQASGAEPPEFLLLSIFAVLVLLALAVLIGLTRSSYLRARDGLIAREQHSRQLTGPMLRTELARRRTGHARVRLLRRVLSETSTSMLKNRDTYNDLSAFVVALEAHLLAIHNADPPGIAPLFGLRIHFDGDYRSKCLTEYQHWCLEHYSTADSSDGLDESIDILTQLLVRLEHAITR